jgi:Transmembrane secretion effector
LALIYSEFGTLGSVTLTLFARLPDSTADLSPWNHWRMPVIVKEVGTELLEGPVLVTIEYSVVSGQETEFVKAIRQYARIRRRDGAYRWGVYRDTEVANRFVEIFLVHSWAEHLRQHQRQTKGDREVEQQVFVYVAGEPKVQHLLYADSTGS